MKHTFFSLSLLIVALIFSQGPTAFAADPAGKELLPLVEELVKSSPTAAHPFGPQFPPGLHRNYFKVKIVQVQNAETAGVQPFLKELREGTKVWPVRVYVLVSYEDPSKGATVLDGEFSCYARRGENDQWMVGSVRPVFKKFPF